MSLVLPCIIKGCFERFMSSVGCVSRQKEAKRENYSFCDQEELESNLGLAWDFLVSHSRHILHCTLKQVPCFHLFGCPLLVRGSVLVWNDPVGSRIAY